MSNRLSGETSPYLLQHRDNPVDWYPWGEEAFARARGEDRPILLSVGYSACHWCHVMEHESFSDPDTASLMNELFVNIKVDREERPDVDSLYMQAVQQMTGHGGWPMTVFLTPEGAPFYGGTYFPPEPRHGLPSFRQLLRAIGDAFRDRREEVLQSSSDLKELLLRGMLVNPEPTRLDESVLHRAFHGLIGRFDPRYGGFGGAPKFPQPMLIDFLLRYWNRTGSEDALKAVERTLESMARGGIYDHLGGGFHRYSVDARWLVPHFEKMLYDNALLARAYLRAHQVTGREDFRRVVEEILEYVGREMRSDEGAFYSSQDADSEGQEGRFYVWSADEIDDVLGPDDGPIFRLHYDVTQHGNWEGESILNTGLDAEGIVGDVGLPPEEVRDILDRGRNILYEHRARRVWPGRDDKVLTSWNAMMMHTFADAARGLDSGRYLEIAIQNAEFLLDRLRVGDRLMRSWRDGSARTEGFLEDYANLADALLALYEASFDVRWVREARAIADRMVELFWSESDEMFYDTAKDAEDLIIRPRDMYDNATPSGTSAAAHSLIRLARLTGEAGYERIAGRVLAGLGDTASRVPQAFGHLLGALVTYFAPPTEVAIVGTPDAEDTRALLRVVQSRYLPATTVAFRAVGATDADLDALLPMLAERGPIDGMAAAYVCRHFACGRPVTAPEDLEREINETIPGPRTAP